MQKTSKPNMGLEEELLIMIHKLMQKKTSKIFREPVDAKQLTDYYEKIKRPIDIRTITQKLKQGKYYKARNVLEDFELMMANCRQYNMILEILKTAEKFQKSIETEWSNFQKELKKKGLNIETPLNITEDVKKRFQMLEDKNRNRKPSNLQINLIQAEKKFIPYNKILPPLVTDLPTSDRPENELPKKYSYIPSKYMYMNSAQKARLTSINLNRQEISCSFDELASKKIQKYKKILYKKIVWIDSKIIKKCLERKRFKKMQTPNHLTRYIENGQIANSLQLRKIQMYVKMVAYWIEEYPQILSYIMKNKFIDTCKTIKRSIFRILRYKVPRSTKIQIPMHFGTHGMQSSLQKPQESNQEMLAEEESKGYENEIKSFKRMLSKDQGETIKKYTKIIIKNQNGEFTVVDWNMENNQKKQKNRSINVSRIPENTEEFLRAERQRERKEQRQKDQQFLSYYRQKSNIEIIKQFNQKLALDWDSIQLKKIPSVIPLIFAGSA